MSAAGGIHANREQLGDRHRRDDVIAGELLPWRRPAVSATTVTAWPSWWRMPTTFVFISTLLPCASTSSRQRSHIIPGPSLGVLRILDEVR